MKRWSGRFRTKSKRSSCGALKRDASTPSPHGPPPKQVVHACSPDPDKEACELTGGVRQDYKLFGRTDARGLAGVPPSSASWVGPLASGLSCAWSYYIQNCFREMS